MGVFRKVIVAARPQNKNFKSHSILLHIHYTIYILASNIEVLCFPIDGNLNN